MAFEAKILADSINRWDSRLTTMVITYPRCIHSEFMTHRVFSRNSASSRAIPVKKMLQSIVDDPFVPIKWGLNQKGMQAGGEHKSPGECRAEWLAARDNAVRYARNLNEMGLHKQLVNRITEPWMWITVIATATNWSNFFKLRCHKDAEPHMQKIAYMMRDEYVGNQPQHVEECDWHLPLFGFDGDEKLEGMERVKVATARCARVSYLTHEGTRDVSADIVLHDRLKESRHWSPFEHCAKASSGPYTGSNLDAIKGKPFSGWHQYRKYFAEECA